MRALCLLRDSLAYRKDCFTAGLIAAGHEVVKNMPGRVGRDDLLVIWNRYGAFHETAKEYERAGGKVIVCENGHLGKRWRGGAWYAMALNHHAGAGSWPYGGPERWDRWDVPLEPFREGGTEYVITAQRGIGEDDLKSPPNWAEFTAERIHQKLPFLRVRIRAHPGANASRVPLEEDLRHAAGLITWHSAAALEALTLGFPVWYHCPSWIGRNAGRPLKDLFAGETPCRDAMARLEVFRNVAWGMWELSEISAGAPFRHLLETKVRAAA